jgi:hypothetical protein
MWLSNASASVLAWYAKAGKAEGDMRFAVLILGALALASCATSEDDRFRVGESEKSFVIIGVAEASESREARYTLLWRQLDAAGAFTEYDGHTTFEAQTNEGDTVRVRGIPGEFEMLEVEPGVYALDSVFGIIADERVNYVAEGVIAGPERPSFEVRPGEAIYLGIWQADIEDVRAVTRPWRIEESDLRAVLNVADDEVRGHVRIRETRTRSVACTPHQLNSRSRRQVC